MTPREQAEAFIKEGRLDDAAEHLKAAIRKEPANADLRVFLFQLLSINGEWDKATTQLQVAAELSPANGIMSQVCGPALLCEKMRENVFNGKRTPLIFGEPEEWVGLMVEAGRLFGQGHRDKASEVRAKALDLAEPVPGSINGQPFEWLTDADDRMGPIFEAIVDGKYYWIPMGRVRSVRAEPPTDLRDLIWQPASFQWVTGGESVGLLLARYPGSHLSGDPSIRMARKTEWNEHDGGMFTGLGQREFATDAGEFPVLEVREILLGDQSEQPADPAQAQQEA